MKRLLTPLAAACLLASANSLHAAPYSALYVFGDSLSDAGWFADADGPAGATTRFTNRVGPTYQDGSGEAYGPVAPMLLGEALGLGGAGLGPANTVEGGNNWAVGGYRTDEILDTISGPGGYLASSGGRADPNALYYLTGGGNDFLQFRVIDTASAQAAAGRLVDSVEVLQQAGARYIMVWLLPDIGLTPDFYGGGLQDFVSALGSDFNQEVVSQLTAVNANVIPLNIPLNLSEILADPGRYGLVDDRDAVIGNCFNDCTNQHPVYGVNGTDPDPTKLLFDDSVHPTIAGQRFIADSTSEADGLLSQQSAASKAHADWGEIASGYVVALTVLAVSLFILGLAQALPPAGRLPSGLIGIGMATAGLGWALAQLAAGL